MTTRRRKPTPAAPPSPTPALTPEVRRALAFTVALLDARLLARLGREAGES